MKKKQIWLMAIVTGALVLCGCGTKTEPTPESQQQTQTADEETEQEASLEETDQEASGKQDEELSEEQIDDRNLEVLIEEYYESEHHAKAEYFDVAVARYPMIHLGQEDAKAFPELEKALEDANQKQKKASQDSLKQLAADYKEYYEDQEEEDINYDYYFSDEVSMQVLRADTRVLSLEGYYYGFSGGAHGYYGHGGYNYDTKTGKELQLSDVTTDTEKLLALVAKRLPEEYPEVNFIDLDVYFKETPVEDQVWSLSSTGIKFYFSPYVLASYAEGEQIVFIPFSDQPDLFVEDYSQVPDFYVTPIIEGEHVYVDADGDGALDSLVLNRYYSETEEGFDIWKATVNEKTYSTEEDYVFGVEGYLVHAGADEYLYLFESRENDYSILKVINLKDMKEVNPGSENMNLHPYGKWNDQVTTKYAFTNPNDMLFESRMNMMSTYAGWKHYFIGDNGIPYAEEAFYSTDFANVLTAKQDIECQIVDVNGVVLEEKATIPEGSYLRIVRTDGLNIAEMLIVDPDQVSTDGNEDYQWKTLKDTSVDLENATIYRIQTYESDDEDAWEILLNGKPAYDQFDGIMFAG